MTQPDRQRMLAKWLDLVSLVVLAVGAVSIVALLGTRDDRAIVGELHNGLPTLVASEDDPDAWRTPLLDVAAPDDVRRSQVWLCLVGSDGEAPDQDALDGLAETLELVWRADGEVIARRDLAEAYRSPRYGDDRRCIELEATALELPGDVPGYSIHLAGDLDIATADEHAETAVVAMVVDAKPVRIWERLAVMTLLLAMVLRLLAWHFRRLGPVEASGDWRWFDPLAAVAGSIVLTTAVALAMRPRPDPEFMAFTRADTVSELSDGVFALGDIGQLTLVTLLCNAAVYVGLAWGYAKLRSRSPHTALRTVNGGRFGIGTPLFAGIALAIGASILLATIKPDQTSPMQLTTSLPSTMLATAAVASLSPWFEELFFRGLLFGSLERTVGRLSAAFVVVALFALAHVPQHLGFLLPVVPILIVAILATWLRYASGSTTPSFALHLGYNAMLVMPALLAG